MPDLRTQLQATLSGSYTLERELGGAGMSRVFVAEETRLGRKVVVKVLSPELAAGISAERFEREMRMAASLQQANIVPVLSAGDTNGLPFYTMPFVEGESLRARLATGVPLPTSDVLRIIGDVARALQYAHERGIVHRDIKPDNILLSGGTAVVTDFGIAKAISAARTGVGAPTLTQFGTSIGTPAYMAPEQAAGDPDIDARADIYALGCTAYELLVGRPPFHGKTAQRVLAAHMGETPESIAELRPDLPEPLSRLVMQCLAKDAGDRPQSAAEVILALNAITSGSGMPAMPQLLMHGPAAFRRALVVYAVALVGVVVVAWAATSVIGLPTWVLPGAIIIMALVLPVILFTGYVQAVTRRALTATPALTPGGGLRPQGTMATLALKASPHLSWRRATRGGLVALAAFVVLIVGFMVMRALGIGPVGSLLAKGALRKNEPLLVADFTVSNGADSSLGPVLSEAVRTDLSQSTAVRVLPASAIREALQRMQRPATSRLDVGLARDIAQREGARAVVSGDVTPLGDGFIVTERLLAAENGNELASYQETANGPSQLIPTVQKLTRNLRGKIGESLRSVQSSPALEQVTTSSLDALKKYQEGVHAFDYAGEVGASVARLTEATAIDSTFAMAWRKLAAIYAAGGYSSALMEDAAEHAFRFRDRLTEGERYNAIGMYYLAGPAPDRAKAIAAYEALDSRGIIGPHTNNLGYLYSTRREYARAESVLRRGIATGQGLRVSLSNLSGVLYSEGRLAEAESINVVIRKQFPTTVTAALAPGLSAFNRGQLDSAYAELDRAAHASDASVRTQVYVYLALLATNRGRLADAERFGAIAQQANVSRGIAPDSMRLALTRAEADIWWRDRPAAGVQRLDAALTPASLRARPLGDRPYFDGAGLYARAGRPDRARALLAQLAGVQDTGFKRSIEPLRHQAMGEIALAEKRPMDAVREFRAGDLLPDGPAWATAIPLYANLGRAFDAANSADSAIAYFERYLSTPDEGRMATDATYRAGIEKRLGELYKAKGNAVKALEHYSRFVELWKNADPELQPKVAEVRKRMARLRSGG